MDDRRDLELGQDATSFAREFADRRGRPPVVLLVFLVAICGLVVAGFGGRAAGGPAPRIPTGVASPGLAAEVPAPTPQASRSMASIVSSAPGSPIELTISRHPESIFVHGDVYVAGVSWVFVNLIDGNGRVAGWAQVSAPGGVRAPRATGPALRFDLDVALPDWATGPLSVHASAYASDGSTVASEVLGVDSNGSPMNRRQGRLEIGD